MDEYFVILTNQSGGITPLVNDDGELATFSSAAAAEDAAQCNLLGWSFGFEVFKRGEGV